MKPSSPGQAFLAAILIPLVTVAQEGIAHPPITVAESLQWYGETGFTYGIEHSQDLHTEWLWNSDFWEGADADIAVPLTDIWDSDVPPNSFYRLIIAPQDQFDADRDGWTNLQEIAWGWDVYVDESVSDDSYAPSGDHDLDGLSNSEEAQRGLNPNAEDSDGDSVIDGEDGWPLCSQLAPAVLSVPSYAVISIRELPSGWIANAMEINNNHHALWGERNDADELWPYESRYYYSSGIESTPAAIEPQTYVSYADGPAEYYHYSGLNDSNYFLRGWGDSFHSEYDDPDDPGTYQTALYQEGTQLRTLDLPSDFFTYPDCILTDIPEGSEYMGMYQIYNLLCVDNSGVVYGSTSFTADEGEYARALDEQASITWPATGGPSRSEPSLFAEWNFDAYVSSQGQSSDDDYYVIRTYTSNMTYISDIGEQQSISFHTINDDNDEIDLPMCSVNGGRRSEVTGFNQLGVGVAEGIMIEDYWWADIELPGEDFSGGSITYQVGIWVDNEFVYLDYDAAEGAARHINDQNTIVVEDDDSTVIWVDSMADIRNDLPVDAEVTAERLTRIDWLSTWGAAPPANLNTQMRGFDRTRIWQNGEWLEIADLVGSDQWSNIEVYDMNDAGTCIARATDSQGVEHVVMLVLVEIVPDYDRDGVIRQNNETINGVVRKSDYNRAANGDIFYFWVNDDKDSDSSIDGVGKNEHDIPGQSSPDADDASVGGLRDLIDFFPVHIDLNGLLDNFPDEDIDNGLVQLELSGAPVNFIDYPTSLPNGLTKESASFYRKNVPFGEKLADGSSIVKDSSSVHLSPNLTKLIKRGRGTILLEAKDISDDSLELYLHLSGNRFLIAELAIKFSKVEDMFRHVTFVDTLGSYSDSIDGAEKETRLGQPKGFPDSECNDHNFLYMHGFKVTQQSSRGSQSNVFKRMYQSGSRAKFIGLSWHGAVDPNYHMGAINAFKTSEYIASRLSSLTGEVTIAAHSLANIVISNAITRNGFSPNRYFMINAASPIEAYDSAQSTGAQGVDMALNMTHPDWVAYDSKLYASNWHLLFEDGMIDSNGSPVNNDSRQNLTWKDYFDVVTNNGFVYNFYSEGEEVVRNGEGVVPSLLIDTLWHKGEFAWTQQEMIKGLHFNLIYQNLPYELVMPDQHGGWEFLNITPVSNLDAYPDGWVIWDGPNFRRATQSDINNLGLTEQELNAQLRIMPFFGPFHAQGDGEASRFAAYDGAVLTTPIGAASGINQASIMDTQYKLLAEAIPARSFAVAANAVDAFGANNYHLQDLRVSGEWPTSRLEGYFSNRLLHSDFKDIAYIYVYPVYEKFVEIGGLDE